MVEKIKIFISRILNFMGITDYFYKKSLKKQKNQIRIINYHRTPNSEMDTFEKQITFFSKIYENVNYSEFVAFKKGEKCFNTPRLMITFDDGLMNNYENALDILENNGFTGYFFVSTGKIGSDGYMDINQLKVLIHRGHYVGCHTYNHHRMNESDSDELLHHEIVEAQSVLSEMLEQPIEMFCWCGGETDTYTAKANSIIKKYYKFAFMTNSELVSYETNNYHLQRTNIEARWELSLVKFQLSGIIDKLYDKKRQIVSKIIDD